jgi:hypothetical protein
VPQPPASLAEQLAAPAAAGEGRAPKVALEVPVPTAIWPALSVDAASRIAAAFSPEPTWVAAGVGDSTMSFVVVWGPKQQPLRKQLKSKQLVEWLSGLGLDAAAVKKAVHDAGQTMWRADPVATLRAFVNIPNHVISTAGTVNAAMVQDLSKELGGLATWGERDKALTQKAKELMTRHVLGDESIDQRFLHDDYLLTDLLRRRGPEGFVKEMKARVARLDSEGKTLPALCAEHADGAEPLGVADLHGSNWQMRVMGSLATPHTELRAVLVSGPTRTGKSHVANQLYRLLPGGAVVKVKETDEKDLYKLGTKVGPGTVLLLYDEFEGRMPLAELKNHLDSNNDGQEVRTGSSKSGNTHTELPVGLKWLITSQWRWPKIVETYKARGATEEDIQALLERVEFIDLYEEGVKTRPKVERVDLPPDRVAATVVSLVPTGVVTEAQRCRPFPRQRVPVALPLGQTVPAARPLGETLLHLCDDHAPALKRRRWSAPPALTPACSAWVQQQRASVESGGGEASSGPADAVATQLLGEEEEDEDEEEDAALASVDPRGPDAEADDFVAARVHDAEWAAAGIDMEEL